MCHPAVAIGMMVASGAMQAYSQRETALGEADAARANARLAGAGAADARDRAAREAGDARMMGSRVAGAQRAELGGSGLDLSSKSLVSLFDTTAAYAELDARTAMSNGAREAWGFDVEAGQHRAAGKMARRRSVLGPLGTMIGTAGSAYGASRGWGGGKAPAGTMPTTSTGWALTGSHLPSYKFR